jgi:hypothetical protein
MRYLKQRPVPNMKAERLFSWNKAVILEDGFDLH